jgi:hypothetical protein
MARSSGSSVLGGVERVGLCRQRNDEHVPHGKAMAKRVHGALPLGGGGGVLLQQHVNSPKKAIRTYLERFVCA